MENTVTLSRNDYDLMFEKATKYNQLISYLLNNANYESWSKQLSFNNTDIDNALKIVEPIKYQNTLDSLKREEEEKKNVTTSK